MEKVKELYCGKAKTIYSTGDPNHVVLQFRDDTTAFNGEKKEALTNKGKINNQFNAFIMTALENAGIKTHFIKQLNDQESLVYHLSMFPIECVIRNIAAGSLCRRLGITEGIDLAPPLFEFFLKDDELGDPIINDNHILLFKWATAEEVSAMKQLTQQINNVLQPLFADAGMLLVDYKVEFGCYNGEILLGDEFTPDGCRIWDCDTREKLDKDRFRYDLGSVMESYQLVADRLGVGEML